MLSVGYDAGVARGDDRALKITPQSGRPEPLRSLKAPGQGPAFENLQRSGPSATAPSGLVWPAAGQAPGAQDALEAPAQGAALHELKHAPAADPSAFILEGGIKAPAEGAAFDGLPPIPGGDAPSSIDDENKSPGTQGSGGGTPVGS